MPAQEEPEPEQAVCGTDHWDEAALRKHSSAAEAHSSIRSKVFKSRSRAASEGILTRDEWAAGKLKARMASVGQNGTDRGLLQGASAASSTFTQQSALLEGKSSSISPPLGPGAAVGNGKVGLAPGWALSNRARSRSEASASDRPILPPSLSLEVTAWDSATLQPGEGHAT